MALVDVEGVFYATVLVGGTRQATVATKWASIPACSGIVCCAKARKRAVTKLSWQGGYRGLAA
jgi:hypothetical protein